MTAPTLTNDRPRTVRRLARSAAEVQACTRALEGSARLGLDLETTGLDPRADRTRLLTVGNERETWTLDCFQADPCPLFPLLQAAELVGHFLQFDLSFLAQYGFEPGRVSDTLLASRVLHAGRTGVRHGLAACCERDLGITLDKSHQKDDWPAPLSPAQLDYAATDVEVLFPLADRQQGQIAAGGLEWALSIENRALPAVVWMSRAGVPFDSEAWQALLAEAEQETERLRRELNAAAPVRTDRLFMDELGWNWDSPQEALQALQLAVKDNELHAAALAEIGSTADSHLAAIEQSYPLAGLLRRYRRVRKRVGTYGANWLAMVREGRIYPTWSQSGRSFDEDEEQRGSADAGRMTCARPNIQQVPRATRYRQCVRAPEGCLLVRADYATIELRIAARIAWEPRLVELFASGADLHARTAELMFGGGPYGKESQERQIAKSANFGLLYGLGADGFWSYCLAAGGLVLTVERAEELREKWFGVYAGLRTWHERTRDAGVMETRTRAGRRRALNAASPDTFRLNSPVQGTGADGLKTALGLLWERRRACPGAIPVLASHDEIVLQCPERKGPAAALWLMRAMRDAMEPLIDPVPVEVEAKVGRTWGD